MQRDVYSELLRLWCEEMKRPSEKPATTRISLDQVQRFEEARVAQNDAGGTARFRRE